jgi:peptidyl-prolyl isomerase G (cyclophilin G)
LYYFSSPFDHVFRCCFFAAAEQPPLVVTKELASTRRKKREEESPMENGEQRSNGVEADANSDRSGDRQPDIVDDHPGKSRSTFHSCHTSVILYAYRLFKIRYFIQS